MQISAWTGTVFCVAVAGLAVFADRRRQRRSDLDRIGWIAWPLILILALIGAAIFAAIALQAE